MSVPLQSEGFVADVVGSQEADPTPRDVDISRHGDVDEVTGVVWPAETASAALDRDASARRILEYSQVRPYPRTQDGLKAPDSNIELITTSHRESHGVLVFVLENLHIRQCCS